MPGFGRVGSHWTKGSSNPESWFRRQVLVGPGRLPFLGRQSGAGGTEEAAWWNSDHGLKAYLGLQPSKEGQVRRALGFSFPPFLLSPPIASN